MSWHCRGWGGPIELALANDYVHLHDSYCEEDRYVEEVVFNDVRYLATPPRRPWVRHPARSWAPPIRPARGSFPDRIRWRTFCLIG
jgi:hypothetical protein